MLYILFDTAPYKTLVFRTKNTPSQKSLSQNPCQNNLASGHFFIHQNFPHRNEINQFTMSAVVKEVSAALRRKVPKAASNWPRALPALNVSTSLSTEGSLVAPIGWLLRF
jgi:hypothetical protein